MIILGTNSIKDTGFDVANSLRQNRADSSFLSKTFSGDGTHHDKGTISVWVKRSEIGAESMIYSAGASGREFFRFETNDTLTFRSVAEGFHLNTNRVFRDVSAWYHFVLALDSTQGTASNRIKIYVNGVQETSFATETYPSQNMDHKILSAELQRLGKDSEQNGPYANCYYCEVVGIDGQQLAADQFGEFDSDSNIWKPKNVSGLTFGTNGFHLDFEDSSALGNDVSGNNNDFANTNFTAIDQSSDSCTNNFATMNPLDNYYAGGTFAEGNLQVVTRDTGYSYNTSTFGVATGKWYWEVKYVNIAAGSGDRFMPGIAKSFTTSTVDHMGYRNTSWGYQSSGDVFNNNSTTSSGYASYGVGDIIGIAMDLDNLKLYFSINGTFQNSANPATGSNGITITAPDAVASDIGFYFPALGDGNNNYSGTGQFNFGSPPFAISSGNTDGDGYGNFEYAVPSGYYSLNTKNLSEYG